MTRFLITRQAGVYTYQDKYSCWKNPLFVDYAISRSRDKKNENLQKNTPQTFYIINTD